MSGLTLRLRGALPARTDLGALTADGWHEAGAAAMARRLVLVEGTGAVPAGDLFDVQGTPGTRLVVAGDCALGDRLGARLALGEVVVEGDAGDDAGQAMAGGRLVVRGSAGARAGAAAPGHKKGMTGGELVIHGRAGTGLGAGMRRGLVACGGDIGAGAGTNLIAGTIVTLGALGEGAGRLNRRGSLVAAGGATPFAGYRLAATVQPIWLRLLFLHLARALGLPVRREWIEGHWRRFSGDLTDLGKGELLTWTPS